jgi:putative ABC transport system ATP-binding protein
MVLKNNMNLTAIFPSIRSDRLRVVRQDNGFIELQDISKIYQMPAGSFHALKNVNLTVNAGEFVAVVGKSGSGKSTLLNVLAGIDSPSAGQIWIEGIAIQRLNNSQMAKWRGRYLGIVFQFFQLMPTLTLVENVILPMDLVRRYPTYTERRQRALMLLEMIGMAHQADKLPSEISGGQQQRVAIARALANDPPIIIADEPTGNLDTRTANEVFALFKLLADQGKTLLMVTHDQDLASRVSRVIEIVDGRIVRQ